METKLWTVIQDWREPGPRGGKGKVMRQTFMAIGHNSADAIDRVRAGGCAAHPGDRWNAFAEDDGWTYHDGPRPLRSAA